MIRPQKLLGDNRATLLTLPEKSVHCCITSIPYWGLRSYLPKDHPLKHLEIGCEKTFDLYLDHISEVFKSVHRVLRDDGTLWLNCGDAYNAGTTATRKPNPNADHGYWLNAGSFGDALVNFSDLKCKDLLMMPARVAMRLQSDGWYLRSMIPWLKRNAMPESVTDRPATAVEYVFLFSKSQRYFYDRYAVMRGCSPNTNSRLSQDVADQIGSDRAHAGGKTNGRMKAVGGKVVEMGSGVKSNSSFEGACSLMVSSRNRRNSDWFMESWQGLMCDEEGEPLALIVNPKGTTIKHFASYPPKLVEPMIKASTSERGCCPTCGAHWQRIVDRAAAVPASWHGSRFDDGKNLETHPSVGKRELTQCRERNIGGREDGLGAPEQWPDRTNPIEVKTVDWKPSCQCVPIEDTPDPIPCTVLDPFSGTGCTAMVATNLGRRSISCELNPEYFEASNVRDAQGGLL